MAIKFIVDSASDLSKELASHSGATLVPLHVQFGEKAYLDGVDISSEMFYSMLEQAEKLPTTSQPNPQEFEGVFQPFIDAGDELVVITIASKLSGTYQSAVAAAKNVCPERIHVVDSGTASIAIYILLSIADKLRAEGKTAVEIVEALEGMKDRIMIFAALDSLKYLQMGGRISSTKATIGNMLNLKPIVSIYKGIVENTDVVRGQKRAVLKIVEKFLKKGYDQSFPVVFINDPASGTRELMTDALKAHIDIAKVACGEFGAVVGSYAGPKSAGIAWVMNP